ncbi:MAG TPA: hypothetical protein VFR28_06020, partial [Allosphingosinicella sp.]|nr:hypothetical protein [Allosphingosinicella sp.]
MTLARTWENCANLLLAICLAGAGLVFCPSEAEAATPLRAEQTLAFEMLRIEQGTHSIPPQSEALLKRVLADGYRAGGGKVPATGTAFVAFAERVAISMARNNLLQPAPNDGEPNSLGTGLTPLPATAAEVQAALDETYNEPRLAYLDQSKPLYLVDCDMGAMLLMSVAQMTGFELSLVEVPEHNFVRWHGPGSERVNWDWTFWASKQDDFYAVKYNIPTAQLVRKAFLQSQTEAESRG